MRRLQLSCLFALFVCCFFNGFSQNVLSPYPIDGCNTYTFRAQTGDAAYDNHINDIYGNSTGNSFQVGYTTINGDQDGLLQQLDINGRVTWSRTIGSIGLNERIQSVGKSPNGTLVMTGTIENTNGTNQHPFVAAADMAGNLLWMRSIQTPTDYRGAYVLASKAGMVGMVAENDSTMLYGRFTLSGNLTWLNKVQALPKSKTIGLVDDFRWFIAYTGEEAGRKIGGIMVIDSTSGNLITTKQLGGAATNSDYIFHSVEVTNLRARITGIFSENNQPYQLFRISPETAEWNQVRIFEIFNIPGVTFDVTAFSTQSRWAESMAFTNSATSTDLYVLKAYGEEALPLQMSWARQFTNMGAYSLASMDKVFDGGYLVALNGKATAAPFTPVLSIKVDSAGLASTGCEGLDVNIQKINNLYHPVQTVNLTPVPINFPPQSESYSLQTQAINTQYTCMALNCPIKPVEDTCVTTFYRSFRSSYYSDVATDMTVSTNNEVIVNGIMRDNPIEPRSQHSMLVSFDAKGKLVARKKVNLGDVGYTYMTKQYRLADGNILILGTSSYNGATHVTVYKYTPALTLLWSKAFQFVNTSSAVYDLIEDKDGSIFVWYLEGAPFLTTSKTRLLKLDAAGNLLWSKNHLCSSLFVLGYYGSLCQDDQYLYGAFPTSNGGQFTVVMKIEKATGNAIWAKQFSGPKIDANLYNRIQIFKDKLLISGLFTTASNSTATALIFLDKNGALQSTTTFDYNNRNGIATSAMVARNNEIVLSGYVVDNSRAPYSGFNSYLRLDSNLQVLVSKRTYDEKLAVINTVREATADSGLYEAGRFNYSNPYTVDIYLKKYTYDGTMGNCISENVAYNRSTANFTATNLTVTTGTPTNIITALPYSEDDYSLQQNKLSCSSPVTCFKPTLTGPQQICTAGGVIEYRAQRVPGCTAPVSWLTDPAQVKVISTSDTLLKIQFINNGTTRIKAGVFSGCRWLQDSMDVTATVTTTLTLDLGPDSTLCTGNTIKLNARKGFASYTWQDGSVDSLYTITQPGDYYVTTTDACGIQYSDTVHVLQAPPIPFDLGANQNICINDRISVTAPASFLNYSWSPNYNINTTTAQTAVLSPALDTIYYVKAEKTPGCFALDSIRIYVKQPVPVQLGNDTSFCAGYTLTLNAGNGFAQYKWNTGANSASLPVNTTGNYSIITTDANNCLAYDTVQVNVYNNPTVKLPQDSLLCYGNNMKYDAGSGFAYEWQDGSTAQQYIASAPGKYWVTITDQNNCNGSDTAVITRIILPPSAFLPPDTTVCSYAKTELKPKGIFQQYVWSNAAITPSITVQQGGLYWLQVTDKYNCTGRDSLLLTTKYCLTGFFVPNAFTPRQDGMNDIFKPIIKGTIIKFEFNIYNRWGQRVFQSANWQLGWDGTLAGKQQGNDTFIWTCTYQFENGPVTFEKGTVTLVR